MTVYTETNRTHTHVFARSPYLSFTFSLSCHCERTWKRFANEIWHHVQHFSLFNRKKKNEIIAHWNELTFQSKNIIQSNEWTCVCVSMMIWIGFRRVHCFNFLSKYRKSTARSHTPNCLLFRLLNLCVCSRTNMYIFREQNRLKEAFVRGNKKQTEQISLVYFSVCCPKKGEFVHWYCHFYTFNWLNEQVYAVIYKRKLIQQADPIKKKKNKMKKPPKNLKFSKVICTVITLHRMQIANDRCWYGKLACLCKYLNRTLSVVHFVPFLCAYFVFYSPVNINFLF